VRHGKAERFMPCRVARKYILKELKQK